MTLQEIICREAVQDDQAADAAYSLHAGERDIRLEVNDGPDKADFPAILVVDGYQIKISEKVGDSLADGWNVAWLDKHAPQRLKALGVGR